LIRQPPEPLGQTGTAFGRLTSSVRELTFAYPKEKAGHTVADDSHATPSVISTQGQGYDSLLSLPKVSKGGFEAVL